MELFGSVFWAMFVVAFTHRRDTKSEGTSSVNLKTQGTILDNVNRSSHWNKPSWLDNNSETLPMQTVQAKKNTSNMTDFSGSNMTVSSTYDRPKYVGEWDFEPSENSPFDFWTGVMHALHCDIKCHLSGLNRLEIQEDQGMATVFTGKKSTDVADGVELMLKQSETEGSLFGCDVGAYMAPALEAADELYLTRLTNPPFDGLDDDMGDYSSTFGLAGVKVGFWYIEPNQLEVFVMDLDGNDIGILPLMYGRFREN